MQMHKTNRVYRRNQELILIYFFPYLLRTLGNNQTCSFGNMVPNFEIRIWPSYFLY